MYIIAFICFIIAVISHVSTKWGLIFIIVFILCTGKKKGYILLVILFYFYTSLFVSNSVTSIHGTVIESYDYGCIIQDGFHYYFTYSDENYDLGTVIQAEALVTEMDDATNFNGFSFKDYLKGKRVFTTIELSDIKTTKHFSLKQQLQNYFDTFPSPVNSYTKQLFLGIKDEYSTDLYTLTSSMSLIHLFALSGMHLSILEKWFKKIHLKDRYIYILLGIYVLTTGNLVSLWRSYLQKIFKKYTKIDDLNIIALCGICLMLYNPYYIYSTSFIFSMTLSVVIEITKKVPHHSILTYLSSIPLILYSNYTLPLLGYIYSLVCADLIETVFSCLLINAVSLGCFNSILKWILKLFENILTILNQYGFTLIFKKPSIYFILIYYGILFLYIALLQMKINRKELIGALFVMLTVLYFYPYYNPTSEVTMIDVGQGDCIFIRYPFNQGNVLIDTGGSLYTDYATKRIIPYLESIGVKKLDHVIITHDDNDHCGALESLEENFQVDEVIREGKDFLDFHYIDLGKQEDDNASSLVYTLNLNGLTYLFTGDLPSELEDEVCKQVGDIDVLKVGHHGSDTSTSAYLLEHTSPEIAMIGVGYNHYGHPHQSVLKLLEDYGADVYRTDLNGMIRIIGYRGKYELQVKKQ